MFLFFSSIWASSVLFPVLIHSCSNKLQLVYLAITSHVACWKSHKFPISEGKKEISKNFPKRKSIVYKKLLIDSKRLLWYMFLFLTEHNPSFTSNFTVLNSFLFLTQSELRCSYKVYSYKQKSVFDMVLCLHIRRYGKQKS